MKKLPYFNYIYTMKTGSNAELDRFINSVHIRIETDPFYYDDDDVDDIFRNEDPVLVGEGMVTQILIDTINNYGINLEDVVDDDSSYLHDLIGELYDFDDLIYKEKVIGDEQPANTRNICVIDFLALKPKFRGMGIGRQAINDIIIRFGLNCGVVALYATPIQFPPEQLDISFYRELPGDYKEGLSKNAVESIKKLYQYFSSFGFSNNVTDKRIFHFLTHKINPKFDDGVKDITSF